MNEILKADFSNARIGDKIEHIDGNIATVTTINEKNFIACYDGCDDDFVRLNFDGTRCILSPKILKPVFFYPFDTQFPTIEACTRPLPKIEVDEKVYIWDHEYSDWVPYHFKDFFSGVLRCFLYGKTSFTSEEDKWCGCSWWKLASDETINSGNLHEIEGENG